jgi:hypothetical protein
MFSMQRFRYQHRRRRAFHKFVRQDRPYALWTLLDGTQILTNRKDQPLMRRQPGQPAEPAEQRWYTDIQTEQWIENPPGWEGDDDFRCYRWAKDILACFSTGGDIRKYLALHPVKIHVGESFILIDGKGQSRRHSGMRAPDPAYQPNPFELSTLH